MSKRRLSKQQQRRISAVRTRAADSPETAAHACNGRVVSHFGQQLDVEALHADGPGAATPGSDLPNTDSPKIVRCHQRANLPPLVTGDLVVWEDGDDGTGVVTALAQRRNVFIRPDYLGRDRPVAANLDVVLVVFAVVPQPFPNLIDRYLVAIENLDLQAALVLNKADLAGPAQPEIDSIMSIYQRLQYPLFQVSAHSGAGMEQLSTFLTGKTTVLVGQSGVGKSSLINRLASPDTESSADAQSAISAEVGELSVGKDKGTHTTTTARLFHLATCDLIDSPGIREFNTGTLSPQQVFQGFPELRALQGQCRFRNCRHQGDPGCALAAALQAGDIDASRWESFQRILGHGND